MISTKLASTALVAGVIIFLAVAPASAVNGVIEAWVSNDGSDSNTQTNCQPAAPCKTFAAALSISASYGVISCLTPISDFGAPLTIDRDITIDCSGTYASKLAEFGGSPAILITTANIHVTLRGLDIETPFVSPIGGIVVTQNADVFLEKCRVQGIWTNPGTAISFQSGGRLTIRDSIIRDNISGGGMDLIPSTGNLQVAIQNTIISANAYGVLVRPGSGASVDATFDHVTITNNTGGGFKTDATTSGPITVDISDSTISYNAGNGMNAVNGAGGGGANLLNIKNSVVARNGVAGVQANGANVAALLSNTVLDSNTAGATSVVNGGRLLTYGNNSIVGSAGSGFTGGASLQ